MHLLVVTTAELPLPSAPAGYKLLQLIYCGSSRTLGCQIDKINQVTPLAKILLVGLPALPNWRLRWWRWRWMLQIEVMSNDLSALPVAIQRLTSPPQAHPDYYNNPQTWNHSGIDRNPFYQRELQIVSDAVAQHRALAPGTEPFRHLLDLGAGYGRAARQLSKAAKQTTLFDNSAVMLEVAGRLETPGKQVVGSIDAPWPFTDGSFDLIVGLQIINHTNDLHHFLSELKRVLAPDGVAYLSVGNRRSLRHVMSFRQAVFATAGFRRFSEKIIQSESQALDLTYRRLGAAGLFSPYQSLTFLDALDLFALPQLFSHLLIISLRKSGATVSN